MRTAGITDIDALDVLQEPGQVPEVAPEGIEFGARPVDRDGAADQGGLMPAAVLRGFLADLALVDGGGERGVALCGAVDGAFGHFAPVPT
jgi:hypothetical protein